MLEMKLINSSCLPLVSPSHDILVDVICAINFLLHSSPMPVSLPSMLTFCHVFSLLWGSQLRVLQFIWLHLKLRKVAVSLLMS